MDAETEALLSTLNAQRDHVLGIVDGLSDADLRRSVLPTGWSCLGMVQHLAISVERFWFRGVVAGEPLQPSILEEDAGAIWQVAADTSAESVFNRYHREIELSNAIIATTDIDQAPAAWPREMWPDQWLRNQREILHHVVTETAVHAGHLDATRELIDGRTWMLA